MWVDVTIYFNGKALSCYDGKEFAYNDPEKVFLLENKNPRDYFEYVGDILSMSFEGIFYDVINYGECPGVLNRFNAILDKYGVYYELGNAWNLSLFDKFR